MEVKSVIEFLEKNKDRVKSLDEFGRIVIPKEIREKFKEGSLFFISLENGRIILTPLEKVLEGSPWGSSKHSSDLGCRRR